jgi:hypothetical protein
MWPGYTLRHWLPTNSQCHFKSKSMLCYDQWLVGQSVLVSCTIWGPWKNLYYSQTVVALLMWHALSGKRMCLPFTVAAGPRQHSLSRSQVLRFCRYKEGGALVHTWIINTTIFHISLRVVNHVTSVYCTMENYMIRWMIPWNHKMLQFWPISTRNTSSNWH